MPAPRPARPLVALVLAAAAAAPRPALAFDPFAGPRRALVTAAGGSGVAMDFAFAGDTVALLDQDWEREDVLHVLDRATGRGLREVALGKGSAAAVAADGAGLWVLRRGRSEFLRRFDAEGAVTARVTPDELPPGKLYGLAVDAKAFYFSAVDGERSHLYRLGRTEAKARELAAFDGRVLALTMVGDRLYAALEHPEPLGDDWLLALRADGSVEWRLRSSGRTVMGLDTDGQSPFAMFQRGSEAEIVRLVPDPERRLVLGAARPRHVRFTHRFENANDHPWELRQFLALPADGEFQRVRHLVVRPTPRMVWTDRDGNHWSEVQVRGDGGTEVSMEFDIATVSAFVTVGPDAAPPIESFPKEALAAGLGETAAFDVSSAAVQRTMALVPRASSLAGLLLGVQDTVDDALQIVGPSGPESRASDFLSQGVGRCYGHTLAFAAVARGLGLPVRAAGGIELRTAADGSPGGEAGVHTWNQAYVPGNGWVDIDTQADDSPDGHHSRRGFAQHVDSYAVTFVGAYGKQDLPTQFAQRSWTEHYDWKSADPSRPAALSYTGISVVVEDLPAW